MTSARILVTASIAGGFLLGCGGDPTGKPGGTVDFQVDAGRVETFTPVTVQVQLSGHGMSGISQHGEMHVDHLGGGAGQSYEMTPVAGGFSSRMMFFEPGEHDLHFQGHSQMRGMMGGEGHHRMTVHRQHAMVGPYWVEFELEPAPVLQYEAARIRFLVLGQDGDGPGEPVGGLTLSLIVADPDGVESEVSLTEPVAGIYEGDHTFGGPGLYELHLEIDADGNPASGDFHMPVLASEDDHGLDYMDHRGHSGHGTGT